jgi:hypothetical protein
MFAGSNVLHRTGTPYVRVIHPSSILHTSVADLDPNPDPDPSDPYVFAPPGSGSISQMYGSGSGSLYYQAKMVRKTLIPIVCDFFLTFYLLKIMKMYLHKVISRKTFEKISFCWCLEGQ